MKNIDIYLVCLALMASLAACSKSKPVEPDAPSPETYVKADPSPTALIKPETKIIYKDITQTSGIDFVHENGLSDNKYMPETLGSGCSMFDYDNDGDLDIFFVNSRKIAPKEEPAQKAIQRLYRNDGSGHFTDVTKETGLDVSLYGMGCAIADMDADGHRDIFITAAIDGNRLFKNNGDGTFSDITEPSGLTSPQWTDEEGRTHPYWSTGAAWVDYNRDGWLDLFVCNYVQWSVENDIFTTRAGLDKSYTTPDYYDGLSCLLYKNQGDGTFKDVSKAADVWNPEGKSLGVAIADFNNDHFPDLVVANDTQPNYLYLNKANGTFEETGLTAGIAYDENGRARAGMGIDVAYFNDRPTIAIGNFSHEPISFFSMVSNMFFVDTAGRTRLSRPSLLSLTFGLVFFDYDLDGYVDMAIGNGHIEPDIEKVEKDVLFKQPPQLFKNHEDQRFEDITPQIGEDFSRKMLARGLANGDIDGDGDLDLLLSACGGPPRLLKNQDAASVNHFIRLRLMGHYPNQDAIGAKISLITGTHKQTFSIRTGSSYLSQSELTQTFGLGESTSIDRMEIIWPNGQEQIISGDQLSELEIDSTNIIKQPVES